MNKLIMMTAGVAMTLAAARAEAGIPAWCGADMKADVYKIPELASKDPKTVVSAIVHITCSANPELDAHRAEVDTARAAWGKKLGMTDADWGDAVAWDRGHMGSMFEIDFTTKSIADFTPIDQYRAFAGGFGMDGAYLADMFGSRLTMTGRMGYLTTYCFPETGYRVETEDAVHWALCVADMDAFDVGKVLEEVRADTQHDPEPRMILRWRALEMSRVLAKASDYRKKLLASDEEVAKVFDTAKKAADAWNKSLGTNTKLLDLVLNADSAAIFNSRKLLEACEEPSRAAVVDAIKAIPAKSFANMHDERDTPNEGFATKAANVLAKDATVSLAAVAYVECHPKTGTSDALGYMLTGAPSARGPRDAILAALMHATFKFDDMSVKLRFYPPDARPYTRWGKPSSEGGVVKSVKVSGDDAIVALEKTSMRTPRCEQEHNSNRIDRINSDGSVTYELICDKWGEYTEDTTWPDFHMDKSAASALKPGMVFSATNTGNERYELIAVWANKTAKAPSMVYGATVK